MGEWKEKEKKKMLLEKILVLHPAVGTALSPRLAANFTSIYIFSGLSHACPAAKPHLLLLPHLQKVF